VPVTEHKNGVTPLSQRAQYAKGGIGRTYWDYRDREILSFLSAEDHCIVDVGCGEGITLEKISRSNPHRAIIGIDSLQENVDICRNHGLPARLGDVYKLDFAPSSVDIVILAEVIEHLVHPQKAVQEIHRILKPRGRFIMVYPNDTVFMLARLLTLKWREAFYDAGHVTRWTPEKMAALLTDCGFLISVSRSIPFFFWTLSLHGICCAMKKDAP
jgi:2-polyprenyl-3-methyl-5-hydroxy-6-metoxy-1,4-benzoquinol methylase